MRAATLLGTALVAALLLAPAALASEGRGGFVAPPPAGLWGSVLVTGSDEAPAMLEHRGSASAFLAEAPRLLVRVETHRTGAGTDEAPQVEEHTFDRAAVRAEDGTGLLLRVGAGTAVAIGGAAAPQSLDGVDRMPDAWLRPAGAMPAPEACDGSPCAAVEPLPGLELAPTAPTRLDGRLELAVRPGGAIVVLTADGERRFAAEQRTETRERGGVEVPLLGTVGAEQERTDTVTSVTLLAEQARATFQPEASGAEARPGPATSGKSAPERGPPAAGTRLLAPAWDVELEGALGLRDAVGAVEVGGQRHEARGAEALVAGDLRLRVERFDERAGARGGLLGVGTSDGGEERLRVEVAGDVTAVDVAGAAGTDGVVVYQAAAVAGAAGALGLLALFAPAAKYGFSKVMAMPLYARLEKQHLLDNGLRAQLLQLVRQDPGRSPSELAAQMPCSWNTLVYHLSVLEREGYVSKARDGRRWRFFPTGAQDHRALPALAALRNPRAAQLVEAVRAQPGIAQHELSARVALHASTVHWHMARLAEAGLVRAERDGRVVRYFDGPALRDLPGEGPAEGAAA